MVTEPRRKEWLVSRGIMVIVLAGLIGGLVWNWPPDVNEAHYLVKARHYHQRDFCENDLFATSFETHQVFYLTHGWLLHFLSFETTAWIGRVASWLIVSWGLLALTRCFFDKAWTQMVCAGLIVWLNLKLNLAGEWFVGGIEGKPYAYGFALASLAYRIRGDRASCWVLAGLACAFHILVGLYLIASIVAACLITWLMGRSAGESNHSRPPFSRRELLALLISIAFFAAGFVPALLQNLNTPLETVYQASEIQVTMRLAHHQLATQFHNWIGFGAMVSLLVLLSIFWPGKRSKKQLFLDRVAWASLFIAGVGLTATGLVHLLEDGWLRNICLRLLSLYLFRFSDVMVPVALAVHLFLLPQNIPGHPGLRDAIHFAVVGLLVWGTVANFSENFNDPRSGSARQSQPLPESPSQQRREQEAEENWIRTCHWIRDYLPENAVFITPDHLQTFKWYAHRAEVATWKDMPQDAASVVEWHRRRKALGAIPGPTTDPQRAPLIAEFGVLGHGDQLTELAERYGADYLVVEQRMVDYYRQFFDLPYNWKRVYPEEGQRKSTYAVYRLTGH